jgi:hypothetical protein
MIRSLYSLMGNSLYPPVDEEMKNQHIELIISVLNFLFNYFLKEKNIHN